MDRDEIKQALESLLLVSDEPLGKKRAAEILEVAETAAEEAFRDLADEYKDSGRGIQLRRIAGGWRLFTHPGNSGYVEKLVLSWDNRRLTQAALETLAVIAYRQPVTKAEISSIRGVGADAAIASLSAKGLIKEVGREKSPGSPILYGTERLFLDKFGLDRLDDLPPLKEFEPDPATRAEIETGLGAAEPARGQDGPNGWRDVEV